jgi:ketosteroid isomerase-like protein
MKGFPVFILFIIVPCLAWTQNKATREVLANSRQLERIVFDTKDSIELDKLFAKTVVYVHSSGKMETREDAIRGIVNNKSVYIKADKVYPYDVTNRGDSLVVTHIFRAMEKKPDGSENELNLSIELVWAKEGRKWKLFRRQAIKNL